MSKPRITLKSSDAPGLLDRERIAEQPTVRMPVVAKLPGSVARDARACIRTGETEDDLFLRCFLFYRHHNRQDSDTALVAAYERVEREAGR